MKTLSERSRPDYQLTVVTVVRNDYHGLLNTIRSVASQSVRSVIEHCVYDGASTDNTFEAIKDSGCQLERCLSEPDAGTYDAMNKGLRDATGRYTLFLNAGDLFSSVDSAEIALNLIAASGFPDVAVFRVKGTRGAASRFHETASLLFDSAGNHQGFLVRSDVHRQYPFDLRYRIKADRDALLRMFLEGHTFKTLDYTLSIYDNQGISSTAIYLKEYENCQITLRNRTGMRAVVKSYVLRAIRVTLFSLVSAVGLDWTKFKNFVTRQPAS